MAENTSGVDQERSTTRSVSGTWSPRWPLVVIEMPGPGYLADTIDRIADGNVALAFRAAVGLWLLRSAVRVLGFRFVQVRRWMGSNA